MGKCGCSEFEESPDKALAAFEVRAVEAEAVGQVAAGVGLVEEVSDRSVAAAEAAVGLPIAAAEADLGVESLGWVEVLSQVFAYGESNRWLHPGLSLQMGR